MLNSDAYIQPRKIVNKLQIFSHICGLNGITKNTALLSYNNISTPNIYHPNFIEFMPRWMDELWCFFPPAKAF